MLAVRFKVVPEQRGLLLPKVGDGGKVFTVTTAVSFALHPVAVIVCDRKYVVVEAGVTDGLATVELNPDGLLVQL